MSDSNTFDDGYDSLRMVFDEALDRASKGKGKDRHANGQPFIEQPIIVINTQESSRGFCIGQIKKKLDEQYHLPYEEAEKELLDVMVYAAAEILSLRIINAEPMAFKDSIDDFLDDKA